MTLRVKVDGSFVETGGAGGADEWVRPADWLTLPTVGDLEEKFVGLFAVTDDDSNFLALSAAGAYTVDWGDGTVEDVASGVQANHVYDYSLIGAETLSSRGYKQVIVTVTPQSGSNLTTVNLNQRHPTMTRVYNVPWLDITVGSPNLTTLTLFTTLVRLYSVEQVTIKSHAMTAMQGMFRDLRGLQSVPLFNTAGVTNMSLVFNGCPSLATGALSGTPLTISYINCKLSRSALVDIFTNLADLTGLTGQTITITGNWGIADLTAADRLIATDKNWTIVE